MKPFLNHLHIQKTSEKNTSFLLIMSCELQSHVFNVKAWAIQRTQNYPNVLGFHPYDVAMLALLDSYHPRKVQFYALDLKDHDRNLELAIKIMQELNIKVVITKHERPEEEVLIEQLNEAIKVLQPDLPCQEFPAVGEVQNDKVLHRESQKTFEQEIRKDINAHQHC